MFEVIVYTDWRTNDFSTLSSRLSVERFYNTIQIFSRTCTRFWSEKQCVFCLIFWRRRHKKPNYRYRIVDLSLPNRANYMPDCSFDALQKNLREYRNGPRPSVLPSVCVCVRARSITSQSLEGISGIFTRIFTPSRQCAKLMFQPGWLKVKVTSGV
jgi:hypothetical protein